MSASAYARVTQEQINSAAPDHLHQKDPVPNFPFSIINFQFANRLPHRQREAVILHCYDGLSVTEVAWAMDILTTDD